MPTSTAATNPLLVPLAESLEKMPTPAGATACYGALLLAIPSHAHTPAYGHAASYLGKLRQLAPNCPPAA